jgi:hypothetical protein
MSKFNGNIIARLAAAAFSVMLLAGCDVSETESGPLAGSGNIRHIGTVSGGCRDKGGASALNKAGAEEPTQKNPVEISISGDSVRISAKIFGNCGAEYESSADIDNRTVRMYIKDVSDPAKTMNCGCNFTFEFVFERKGNTNHPYTIGFTNVNNEFKWIASGYLNNSLTGSGVIWMQQGGNRALHFKDNGKVYGCDPIASDKGIGPHDHIMPCACGGWSCSAQGTYTADQISIGTESGYYSASGGRITWNGVNYNRMESVKVFIK